MTTAKRRRRARATKEAPPSTERGLSPQGAPADPRPGLRVPGPPHFAHDSEEEFARVLDFYRIPWVYEPRSFPLAWEGGHIAEMFTPDFFLPDQDLYIELTTLKQSLVTEKNRKLRRMGELYPEVKVKLLYRKDYHRFLAKFGAGPLADLRLEGTGRVLLSETQIQRRVKELAGQISLDYQGRHPILVGVLKGVVCFMADLMRSVSIPLAVEFMAISYYHGHPTEAVRIVKDLDYPVAGRHVLLVEDIVDTGLTLNYILHLLKSRGPASLEVCTLLDKKSRRLAPISLKYVGFEIPDEFVVGYGLDYGEEYRNLPFIAVLKAEAKGNEGAHGRG